MGAGRIILLNGSSSAGKTTLARMLQQILQAPHQHFSIDQFRDGMPDRFRGLNAPAGAPGARGLNVTPIRRGGRWLTEVRFGDHGRAVLRGMRRAVAAFARAGGDVIADDLLLAPDFLADYLQTFAGLRVTFVGVRCPLEVVNEREAARPGRFPGTAAAHFEQVHAHCEYDIEVDTSVAAPRQCAERVAAAATTPGAAFERMRRRQG